MQPETCTYCPPSEMSVGMGNHKKALFALQSNYIPPNPPEFHQMALFKLLPEAMFAIVEAFERRELEEKKNDLQMSDPWAGKVGKPTGQWGDRAMATVCETSSHGELVGL